MSSRSRWTCQEPTAGELALVLTAGVMNRLGTAAASLSLLAAVVAYPPSATAASPEDSAVGAGKAWEGRESFSLSAHIGVLGDDLKGHLRIQAYGKTFADGSVTCLAVHSNRAVIGGERKDASGGAFMLVEDNGSAGGHVPDRAQLAVGPDATAAQCELMLTHSFQYSVPPLTQGNVSVSDAGAS